MSAPRLLTYNDVLEHVIFWADMRGKSAGLELAQRAVVSAYEEVMSAHDWTFLQRPYRIELHAPYSTGTISFDYTGGTYERMVTLTDGAWPDWAIDGVIRFESASGNELVSRVATVESTTVLTLDANFCPRADVDAGETYSIYPGYYILPSDFLSFTGPIGENWTEVVSGSGHEMLTLDRWYSTTGDIQKYWIAEAPDLYGSLALYVWPPSDSDTTLDTIIKRRGRTLRWTGKDVNLDFTGTVSVTSGSKTITGVSTAFEDDMVNSIFRLSRNANNPTSYEGRNPFVSERSIASVTSETSATADATFSAAWSGKGYIITDPIDLGRVAHPALLAVAERNIGQAFALDDQKILYARAAQLLARARGADSRIRQRRVAGGARTVRRRLASYPFTEGCQ